MTTPIWDRLLGTYDDPGVVTVPRRIAPAWMLDETAAVRPEMERYYVAKGRAASDVKGLWARGWRPAEVIRQVRRVQRSAATVEDPPEPAPARSPDPDDDYLVSLAQAASAVLVSDDKHLLGLKELIPVPERDDTGLDSAPSAHEGSGVVRCGRAARLRRVRDGAGVDVGGLRPGPGHPERARRAGLAGAGRDEHRRLHGPRSDRLASGIDGLMQRLGMWPPFLWMAAVSFKLLALQRADNLGVDTHPQ